MRGKRRPEYLFLSLGFALAGIIVTVLMMIVMISSSYSGVSKDQGFEQIVARAEKITGSESSAQNRVSGGMYSLGDYLISVFESPEYLATCESDQQFASDLVMVLNGSDDINAVSGVLSDLNADTRMNVISKMAGDIKGSYKATGSLPDKEEGYVTSASVNEGFTREGSILMGINKTSGSLQYKGKGIRADILTDGSLCHGYLNLGDADGNGMRAFEVSWDTAQAKPGHHEVDLLFRTEDGKSFVVSGGETDIPDFEDIANDRAYEGILPSDSDSSWYRFNCEDRDAYVNVVGMSGDLKASLYDLYGNLVGTNDIAGSEYEVLRAKGQDIAEATEITGIEGLSNCFYVRIQRGGAVTDPSQDINYMLVQSRDVARYNGTYMAVIENDGENVKLIDKECDMFEETVAKANILPLNGTLCDVTVKSGSTGEAINVWPGFDPLKNEYAYYMTGAAEVKVSAVSQEGYAGKVSLNTGDKKIDAEGGEYDFYLDNGLNVMNIEVQSFNGDINEYKFYFLCGDDDSEFYRTTLSAFPQSYTNGLLLLHIQHPDYKFTPYNTGLDFNEALKVEDSGGRSLATNRYNPTYVRPDSRIYDAPDWMAVKTEVVSYYMDPRNFLVTERVFMFERQSFNPEYHTVEGVKAMISGTFMDTDEYDYASAIMSAAQTSGVSPYLLTSRILTEMGSNGQSKLAQGTVEGYEGYYNFYNIGSYGTTDEGGPVLKGAKYARWGYDPEEQQISEKEASYLLPWDTRDKAITGGALWIAAGYINNGQDTLYFQKFDVVDNGTDRYDHQYAGNIMMAYSEGYRYYKSYLKTDQLDNTYEFIIPVYENMPEQYGDLP